LDPNFVVNIEKIPSSGETKVNIYCTACDLDLALDDVREAVKDVLALRPAPKINLRK
jgi:hypothetical protein